MLNPEICDGELLLFRPEMPASLLTSPPEAGDISYVTGLIGNYDLSSNFYFSIFFRFKKLGPWLPIGFEPLNLAMCLDSLSRGDCCSTRAVTTESDYWSWCKNWPFKTNSSILTFKTRAFFAGLFLC